MGGEGKGPMVVNRDNDPNIFMDADGNAHELPPGGKVEWRVSGYACVLDRGFLLTVIPQWVKNEIFDLPGGGISPRESLEDGILRECKEESGHTVRLESQIPIICERNFYLHNPDQEYESHFRRALIIVYRGSLVSKIGEGYVGHEIRSLHWRYLNDIRENMCRSLFWPYIRYMQHNR